MRFEGEPYGGGVSFFLINNEPGAGPDLHRHPYSETWIVRSGRGRFTTDGVDIEAGPGDIIVATAGTPHKFKNIGAERLVAVCIHAAYDPGGLGGGAGALSGPAAPSQGPLSVTVRCSPAGAHISGTTPICISSEARSK